MRPMPKPYYWILLILLLTACNLRQYYRPATPTPIVRPTPAVAQTNMVKVDGLRMAYISHGNLYVQDSGELPRQLTSSGKNWKPTFSDDGQKIIFFRGVYDDEKNVLYSIDADGSHEQVLVSNDLLVALGFGYGEETEISDYYMAFVSNSHQILFSTDEFHPDLSRGYRSPQQNRDVLLVDTDSAQIKLLVPSTQASFLVPNRSFHLSPDGKLVAVQLNDHIDVIGLDGKPIAVNIAKYHLPNWLNEYIPLYWTPDSNKLIILPPTQGNGELLGEPEQVTIQTHPIHGGPMSEIQLTPVPINRNIVLSPDQNWAIYAPPVKDDLSMSDGIYLANLRDGTSHLITKSLQPDPYTEYAFHWSPDSLHFMLLSDDYAQKISLCDLNLQITPVSGQQFLGWLDDNRYLIKQNYVVKLGEIGTEKQTPVIDLSKEKPDVKYDPWYSLYFTYRLLKKVP